MSGSEYQQDLKERVAELEKINKRLELALEASHIGVWEVNLKDFSVIADEQTYKMYDVEIPAGQNASPEDWLKKIVDPEDRRKADLNIKNIFEEKTEKFEHRFQIHHSKYSEPRYIQVRAKVISDNQGTPDHLIGASWDITEQLKLEQELDEGKSQVVQASKMSALGEMAGGIAHEINNPLTIIHGYAHRIRTKANQGDSVSSKSLLETLEFMDRSIQRIIKIITGLQSFSRDGSKDSHSLVQAQEIAEETLTFCQTRFMNHNIRLLTDFQESLEIDCRPTQISQVLLNLLNNAFDAVLESGNAAGYVKLSTSSKDDVVIFSVEDNGSGIEDKHAHKILAPFFTTKAVGKGTGLGLSISRGIVDSHKGQIKVSSLRYPTRIDVILPKKQKSSKAA